MRLLTDATELTAKDIVELKGCNINTAYNVRAFIRKKLEKRAYSAITYAEYKQVFDIKL